jgi:hypothetical protein
MRDTSNGGVDAIAAYHAGLAERRAIPDATPPELAARFAEPLALDGESAGALLADWQARVVPLSTAVGSPLISRSSTAPAR